MSYLELLRLFSVQPLASGRLQGEEDLTDAVVQLVDAAGRGRWEKRPLSTAAPCFGGLNMTGTWDVFGSAGILGRLPAVYCICLKMLKES